MTRKRVDRLETALFEQYSDRSLFLHRSLKSVGTDQIVEEVTRLSDGDYKWDLPELNISGKANQYLTKRKIKKVLVFCHPSVIAGCPHLILYYRNVVGLTQKGVSKLAAGTGEFERGARTELSADRAVLIARALNGIMSNIITADVTFEGRDIVRNLIASLGITLDGSWRNKVGEKATKEVKLLFATYLKERKLLKKAGKSSLALKEGIEVRFASDPDVAVYAPGKKLVAAIEIKGGIDDAGALERYGAARKSFDKARRANVRCHTIYLASCITKAVRDRIEQDGLVSEIQDLLEIQSNPKKARKFLDDLFNHVVRVQTN